jgi:hypothetical protein
LNEKFKKSKLKRREGGRRQKSEVKSQKGGIGAGESDVR